MRVSYSMLSAWEARDYDKAIAMFLGQQTMKNEAMQAGIDYHEQWEQEVKVTRKLPSIFGAKDLNNPETEVKIEKRLTDWLTLVGVIDLRDIPDIYEYKTGRTNASAYARSHQHTTYQVLDPRATMAHYFAYNQYTNTVTYERVHLTEKSLEDGIEWVVSLAADMKATLENMGYDTSGHKNNHQPLKERLETWE